MRIRHLRDPLFFCLPSFDVVYWNHLEDGIQKLTEHELASPQQPLGKMLVDDIDNFVGPSNLNMSSAR